MIWQSQTKPVCRMNVDNEDCLFASECRSYKAGCKNALQRMIEKDLLSQVLNLPQQIGYVLLKQDGIAAHK